MTTFTITSRARDPYYHISENRHGNLAAICRHRPAQIRRHHAGHDDTDTIGEMLRKWENTVHPDLRCTACTSEARRRLEAEAENGRPQTTRRADAGPAHQDRQEAS